MTGRVPRIYKLFYEFVHRIAQEQDENQNNKNTSLLHIKLLNGINYSPFPWHSVKLQLSAFHHLAFLQLPEHAHHFAGE